MHIQPKNAALAHTFQTRAACDPLKVSAAWKTPARRPAMLPRLCSGSLPPASLPTNTISHSTKHHGMGNGPE